MAVRKDEKRACRVWTAAMAAFVMVAVQRWDLKSKVLALFSAAVKDGPAQETVKGVEAELLVWAEVAEENNDWREAMLYYELLVMLDKRDRDMRNRLRTARRFAGIEKQVAALFRDSRLPPSIGMQAESWFHELAEGDDGPFEMDIRDHLEVIEMIANELNVVQKEARQVYATLISEIKKRHPAIYRLFKQGWDDLIRDFE